MTPKAQVTKEKTDTMDFMEILKICASKDTINGVKRQPTEWEKIFANYVSDKGLISRKKEKTQKQKNMIQKWTKNLNRHLSKEGI